MLRRTRKASLVAATAVAAIVGGLVVAEPQNRKDEPSRAAVAEQARAVPSTQTVQQGPLLSFAPIVKKTTPAVVNISSARVVRANELSPGQGRRRQPMPFDFRDFFGFGGESPFGPPPGDRRESGTGSGVIISSDGHLLTNNHVVEGATEVTITLSDRRELKAKIVGTDPQTDIAVLKVDATNLPTLPLADSSKVQVGDIALAIGNPFGIGQSVTMGVVSGTGRHNLNPGNYEDFIQTDAAINPGNSGGALINTNGELIGINTAIISGTGGNQGIGFAVPANMARGVMDQIIKTGKVTRGQIGVVIQDLTPALARAFNLKENRGVAISEVQPDSPASRAGIQKGDVVISMNGSPVSDVNTFRNRVSSTAPGTKIDLKVVREGQQRDVSVTLEEQERGRVSGERRPGAEPGSGDSLEGVNVEPLTEGLAEQLRLPAGVRGVVVTEISQASDAFASGLRRGDVIEEVNRKSVASVADFERAVRAGSGKSLLFTVKRGGGTLFLAIEKR